MQFSKFKISPHNQHYEGDYNETELNWRRVCAVEKVDNIQSLLKNHKVSSVLEVCCGTGAVLAELVRRGIGQNHEGIDVADPDVHRDSEAAKLKLSKYDGETCPYTDNFFDFTYASHVLEHVPEPRKLINEMARVTKSLIYFEVPCELHLRTTYAAMQTTLNIGHINSYTPESFSLLLQTSGLEIIDFGIFDHRLEVHSFFSSRAKGITKMIIRQGLLKINPYFASRIFTYHRGALAAPSS